MMVTLQIIDLLQYVHSHDGHIVDHRFTTIRSQPRWSHCRSQIYYNRFVAMMVTLQIIDLLQYFRSHDGHIVDHIFTTIRSQPRWSHCRSQIYYNTFLATMVTLQIIDLLQYFCSHPLQIFCFLCRSEIQDGRRRNTQINIGPYGKIFKCLLLRNYKYD